MTLGQIRKELKVRLPWLAYLASGRRYKLEIRQTIDLIKRVVKVGEKIVPESVPGTVVINSVRTYIPIQMMTESMLALKLYHRGHKVIILYDDGQLTSHDTLNKASYASAQSFYSWRRKFAVALYSRLPIIGKMLTPYSDYIENDRVDDCKLEGEAERESCEGIDLRAYVRDSLVRYFVSVPDPVLLQSEPDYEAARQMFLDNCRLTLIVARQVYKRHKPSLFITSHGIYSTWGPFMKYMSNQGVRSVTCGCNIFSINGLDVAVNQIAAAKSDDGYLDHFVNNLLGRVISKEKVIGEVDAYMDRRFSGATKDTGRLRHAEVKGGHQLVAQLSTLKDHGKRIFAIFPNIMWDVATTFEESNRVFDGPVKWLVETVRYFSESADKVLVIRVHPGEHTLTNVRKSIRDILEYYLGVEIFARANIFFVPSAERLNSNEMFDLLSGGIVYNGTIGLELMHHRIPLIIGAQAAYSDRGFTYDIKGAEDYFSAFDRTDQVLAAQEADRDRAKYFIYERFFLHGVPVEYMSNERHLTPNLAGRPEAMWADDNLDHIVAVMLGEKKFVQDYWLKPEA